MKWFTILAFSGLTAFGIVMWNGHASQGPSNAKELFDSFAVLELFTSEGCSSCPPADRLLSQFTSLSPNVIPLSFHVDYWDRLGWKDRFSNSQFTDRQRLYGQHFRLQSIYTPQLIINGGVELVGSNKTAAETDIKKSLSEKPTIAITLDDVQKDKGKVSVECHLQGEWKNCDLLAAIVQKHAETNVKAGENHGAKLSHTNVVRTFIGLPASEKIKFEIEVPDDIATGNWQLILYAQQRDNLRITGAAVYD